MQVMHLCGVGTVLVLYYGHRLTLALMLTQFM
jgi:hypothetical protein